MADGNPYKPFYSVLVLAFACSALVAGAAVGLRPFQEQNKLLDQKKNILYAADLYDSSKPVDELFKNIETRIVELSTGQYVSEQDISPDEYNQVKATLNDQLSKPLSSEADIASLGRLEKYSLVYLVKNGDAIQQVVLPVRGKGLWSTMYAYIALDKDLTTVRGISFYEHGETPGLGGEIENRQWQQSWQGKKVYNENKTPVLSLVKGKAATSGDTEPYQIDGLSGATLTADGVNNLLEFWFGDHGFKPYLKNMKGEIDG